MPAQRLGGSPAFVDPRLRADRADPVWIPPVGATRLCFNVEDVGCNMLGGPGLLIPDLANIAHILLDTLGRQHVVLRAGSTSLQLTIDGQDGIIAPVVLAMRVRGRSDIGTVIKVLAKLEKLIGAPRALTSTTTHWTAETQRLRDALIALDAFRAGATLRETAVIIYGAKRIDRDWPGKGLRIRMHRNLYRGLALSSGGYRDLLS